MKLTKEQIENNTKFLSITQSGRVLMTSPLISNNPKDHQEGRAVEIMFTFEGIDPYFFYYFNEEYYNETSNNLVGLGGLSNRTEAEENRNSISQFLASVLVSYLNIEYKIDLSATPCNYSHNYTNTNTIIFVESLNDWYPIRHAMNEGEDGAEIKVKKVNSGKAEITDYISIYDLSPRDAEVMEYENEDNVPHSIDDEDDSWLEDFLNTESEGIDHSDYELLKEAPFIIFILMALADGEIDLKETTALAEVILNPSVFKNDFFVQVIRDAIPQITHTSIPECLTSIMSSNPDYLSKLQELKRVIDENLDTDEALQFKRALIKLGYKIADASGGLFGLGSRVCKQEKQMLKTIANILGVIGV